VVTDLQDRAGFSVYLAVIFGVASLLVATPRGASAQAATPKAKAPPAGSKAGASPARQPSNVPKAAPQTADDKAAREQILNSDKWKQTISQFVQWLDAQTMYDPQEVKQTKSRLEVGIGRMTAAQLQWFENDLEEKLQVLNSAEAQEATAYLAQTLAVASPAYARKLRQKLPDLLTTTAAQVNQQLAAFATKRQSTIQMQQTFADARQQQIAQNQVQIAEQQQVLNQDLDRESAAAIKATKGNDFKSARDYFPNAGNDGPFGPGTSVGFLGGGFF
jgi:hypothetical protein